MSAPDVATLPERRDESAVRRARGFRRVGLATLVAVVLAGLAGLFGIRSSTATTTGHGYTLAVQHAVVTRAGIAVPLHVQVRHPGGYRAPVTLAVSESLLERFDFQNFYPNPAKETASGTFVYYQFDPPPGAVFALDLDARTAPDQNGSVGRYEVRLMDGSAVLAGVSFRMWVAP